MSYYLRYMPCHGVGWVGLEELQADDPLRVGPYLLVGRLGAGGMGEVFLGRSPGGRLVAVKVIRAERARDPGFRGRFAREVVAARRVGGAFTAPVIDADPEAPLPWLVTSFVNGPSLAEAVDNHGILPEFSVLALAAGLAEGLSAVHAAGVVHRDLKPANVLLAEDGPRVIDFGISQTADITAMTNTGTVMGSPGFMSPEQAEGKEVGPASDIFSLGAVLVFASTGEGPFGVGTATAQLYRVVHSMPRLGQLPNQLRPLVERCMAKDPAQRPTAAQFLAELIATQPAAANLVDWLPASVLPLAPSLHRTTGQPHEPTTSAPASPMIPQLADPAHPPAPTKIPLGALSSDEAWSPTLTAATDQSRNPAHPTEEKAAGDVASAPEVAGDGNPATPPAPRTPLRSGLARLSRPTPKINFPARFTTAAGIITSKLRRPWALPVIGATAALGIVAGLIVAAPWKSPPPPVLRPTGLLADSSTPTSVSFRWSGPVTGPAPDRYEIVRDLHRVGSVPGNITFYRDNGLAPDSSYHFQVIAVREGKRSPKSSALNLNTVTPPVSAAVLDGIWSVTSKVTGVRTAYGPLYKVGNSWSDDWNLTSACSAGPCDVKVSGELDGVPFATSLTRSGAMYTGTAQLKNYTYCVHPNNRENGTIDIRIHVTSAATVGSQWEADQWTGTVILKIAQDPKRICASETDNIATSSTY